MSAAEMVVIAVVTSGDNGEEGYSRGQVVMERRCCTLEKNKRGEFGR